MNSVDNLFHYREHMNSFNTCFHDVYMLDIDTLNEQELNIIKQIEELAHIENKNSGVVQIDNNMNENTISLRLDYPNDNATIDAVISVRNNKHNIELISMNKDCKLYTAHVN